MMNCTVPTGHVHSGLPVVTKTAAVKTFSCGKILCKVMLLPDSDSTSLLVCDSRDLISNCHWKIS